MEDRTSNENRSCSRYAHRHADRAPGSTTRPTLPEGLVDYLHSRSAHDLVDGVTSIDSR
jgi:hypothetical protein